MRAEPLRDTRTHHASAYHSGVHDLGHCRFGAAFLVFLCQEKIADQILSRFGFAKIDNRVQLKDERLLS